MAEGLAVPKPYTNNPVTQKPTEKPSVVHQLPTQSQKPVNGQGTLTVEKPSVQQVLTKPLNKPAPPPPMSRPLSAPLVEGSRPNSTSTTPVISISIPFS